MARETVMDTSNWGEFRIGDLFEIKPTKSYGLVNALLFEEGGKYPVVVNSKLDNGIGGYTNLEPTEVGPMVTFSDTTTSESVFCQPGLFVGYSHVQGLYPYGVYIGKWSLLSLQFFTTVFRQAAVLRGFEYGDKFTRDLAKEMLIKLPVTVSGDPDWEYMEAEMLERLELAELRVTELDALQVAETVIDTSDWGEFLVSELFESISSGKCSNAGELQDGDVPYVGASLTNNGVVRFVSSSNDSWVEEGNSIVLIRTGQGGIGRNTYQDNSFVAHANVSVARHPKLNVFTGNFLVTCLNESVNVFGYEYSTGRDLQRETVRLPVTNSGDPDWEYMEAVMKRQLETAEVSLDRLIAS